MAEANRYFNAIDTFTLPATLLDTTLTTLRTEGESRVESLVFWAGHVSNDKAVVTHVFVPTGKGVLKHPLYVRIDDAVIAAICGELDPPRLVLLGQVHTHIGDAFHSSTDDRFSLDTPGYVSVVIPTFGRNGVDSWGQWAFYERESRGQFRELDAAERTRRFLIARDGNVEVRYVRA
jgi:hypothetical protein